MCGGLLTASWGGWLQSAGMLTIDTFLWCYLRQSYTFSVLFWVDLLSVVCALLEVRSSPLCVSSQTRVYDTRAAYHKPVKSAN